MKYLKIKKQEDFQKIFSKGKRLFSHNLTILYTPSKYTRMGISVGKKHGKAVQRNRLKRLLREAFRLSTDSLKGTYSFILFPKPKNEYSFLEFKKSIKQMFEKGNL